MSDKNLAAEVRRLNEIIKAVERQRNEALTSRAHAEANAALLQEIVREGQAAMDAAKKEIANVKKELADLKAGNEAPGSEAKNAA